MSISLVENVLLVSTLGEGIFIIVLDVTRVQPNLPVFKIKLEPVYIGSVETMVLLHITDSEST